MDIKVIASSSKGNCYRISDGETALLIECGIPIGEIRKALNFKLSEVAGCFVSHCHQDHAKAAVGLARIGVDIYTSAGTAAACGLAGHRVHILKALQEIKFGTFKVLPFDVQHDVPEPLGFLFHSIATNEKLLFFSDTFYVRYRFNQLDYIMAEANYDTAIALANMAEGLVDKARTERLMESHMSIDHLMDFLKANDMSKVRQIYLLHLSEDNSDAARFADMVRRETGVEVYTT